MVVSFRLFIPGWIALAGAMGCSSSGQRDDEDSFEGSGAPVGDVSDTTASTSTGEGDETGGARLDVHGGNVDEGSANEGCAKVDFLFVIDNSISMQDQQEALIASFPGFIAAIEDTLPESSDFHVMVIDSDAHTRCTPEHCADPNNAEVPQVRQLCLEDASGGYACSTEFAACDVTLGAGVTHAAGEGSTNAPCEFASGRRYMDSTEPDLAASFACAARVGLAGWPTETPMDAMVAALSSSIAEPGACNEGFLRDDAVLVVTFISDDPNQVDSGTPQAWYQAVVDAKGGDPSAVVVLGLIPAFEGCGPADRPDKGAHWAEFVGLFDEQGTTASVCEPDYSSFFAASVSVIDEACDSFVPPG